MLTPDPALDNLVEQLLQLPFDELCSRLLELPPGVLGRVIVRFAGHNDPEALERIEADVRELGKKHGMGEDAAIEKLLNRLGEVFKKFTTH